MSLRPPLGHVVRIPSRRPSPANLCPFDPRRMPDRPQLLASEPFHGLYSPASIELLVHLHWTVKRRRRVLGATERAEEGRGVEQGVCDGVGTPGDRSVVKRGLDAEPEAQEKSAFLSSRRGRLSAGREATHARR